MRVQTGDACFRHDTRRGLRLVVTVRPCGSYCLWFVEARGAGVAGAGSGRDWDHAAERATAFCAHLAKAEDRVAAAILGPKARRRRAPEKWASLAPFRLTNAAAWAVVRSAAEAALRERD